MPVGQGCHCRSAIFEVPARDKTNVGDGCEGLGPKPVTGQRTHFLSLPLEIRQQIYKYLLPFTFRRKRLRGNEVVWVQRHTAWLATNRQVHDEAASMLYGDNTFVIDVRYDKIIFTFRRLTSSGFVPKQTPRFLEVVSQDNRKYIRNVVIGIENCDSYTGMIKYNCGGRGLTHGIRLQVEKLVEVLGTAHELHSIQINLTGESKDARAAQQVVEPLLTLRDVRDPITVTGPVTVDFTSRLKRIDPI